MNVNNGVKVDCRVSQSTVCTRSWHVEGGPHGRKGHSLCDGQHGREFSCTWGRWIFLVGCPFELRGDLVLMKGDIQSLFLFPGQCKRVREQTGKASCILEGHLFFMGVPSPGNIFSLPLTLSFSSSSKGRSPVKRKLSWLRSTVIGTTTGNGEALYLSPNVLIHNLPLPLTVRILQIFFQTLVCHRSSLYLDGTSATIPTDTSVTSQRLPILFI